MTTFNLPTFAAQADHRYNITLDGVFVALEFHYNTRADRWTMHLFDIDDVAVRHGVRLVTGIDLLQRVAVVIAPPGQFTVVDTTGADTEPNLTTLGVEALLRYIEQADL